MQKRLSEILLKYSTVGGIEIVLTNSGLQCIHAVILKRSKKNVQVLQKLRNIQLEELNSLDKRIPYYVTISGNRVLSKKINSSELADNPVRAVFPNVNENDFYFQLTDADTQTSYVSIVRKDHVDPVLSSVKSQGLSVVGLFIGPFAILELLPLIPKDQSAITTTNYTIRLNSGQIQCIDSSSEENKSAVTIGNEVLDSRNILSFSSAFQGILKNDVSGVDSERIQDQKDEFRQKKLFEKMGWSFLILFFILLQSNYFILDYYKKNEEQYETSLLLSKDELMRFNKLKSEYDNKLKFLKRSGLLESSRLSYYVDQLCLDLPESITLNLLEVNPSQRTLKGDLEMISFSSRVIHVNGFAKSTVLNDWLKVIKTKPWVKEVVMLDYHQDKEKIQGEFRIEIKLNEHV